MLGEAARTEADARRYHLSYSAAITAIARAAKGTDIRSNPGISVKLSALHPRYEVAKRERVMEELVPRVRAWPGWPRRPGLGFNIDAEEADRLALSLEVIEAVLSRPGSARLGRVRRGGAGLRPPGGGGDRLAACSGRHGWTARSWCGWSRAPIGMARSSGRRFWG